MTTVALWQTHLQYIIDIHPVQLRPEAGFLYDAVWLYARAADKAIRDGKSPSDGKAILSYIKGTSYKSR